MGKLRVAVIGAGTIAKVAHLPNYRSHPDVELAAVADLDADRARHLAEEFGVKAVYTDVQTMLEAEQLDAVSICTPNRTHAALVRTALAHGVDVLVEKPLCTDVGDARRLVEAAQRGGRICMVGMTHRFRSDVQAIKRFIDAGDLGRLYYVRAHILRQRGTPAGWFTDKSKSGGGCLMDIGVHALDLAWWLVGMPDLLSASGQLVAGIGRYQTLTASRWQSSDPDNRDNQVFDVEDFATAYLRFAGGLVLQLEVSWAVNGPQDDALKVDVFGEAGGITLDPPVFYTEHNRVLTESKLSVESNHFYQDEIYHFVECIQQRRQPLCTFDQGAKVVQMLLAIAQSAATGREVRLGSPASQASSENGGGK
ncbi:Gfo/Idh/MocA family protein [Alicyclobacillus kakegawensis]|uniref:Gfo/Idh/MocA family protein n=1 Tax=Alicyclobacillus kakegawensis TaxID=392012 RepID=UPI00082F64C2|nr:Gfo/Idh/MocA family oxidoreductase [Alicyclobacillus kakegawensis]